LFTAGTRTAFRAETSSGGRLTPLRSATSVRLHPWQVKGGFSIFGQTSSSKSMQCFLSQ